MTHPRRIYASSRTEAVNSEKILAQNILCVRWLHYIVVGSTLLLVGSGRCSVVGTQYVSGWNRHCWRSSWADEREVTWRLWHMKRDFVTAVEKWTWSCAKFLSPSAGSVSARLLFLLLSSGDATQHCVCISKHVDVQFLKHKNHTITICW